MNVTKSVKRLALNRETIRELQRDELSAVAGGQTPVSIPSVLPVSACPCFSNGARVCTHDSC
jgi:hypothetical protein